MPSIFDLIPDLKPRSVLPSGGGPRDDEAYLAWRREFVETVNARWVDRRTRFGEDLPGRELISPWLLDEALFRESGGTRLFESPNYQHTLRHLAIAYRDKRALMKRAAQLYAAKRAAECEAT